MRTYIVVNAKDGYEVVLALEEVDPMFQQNQVLVADTLDGKPLDDKHGPLQLVVPEEASRTLGAYDQQDQCASSSLNVCVSFCPAVGTQFGSRLRGGRRGRRALAFVVSWAAISRLQKCTDCSNNCS